MIISYIVLNDRQTDNYPLYACYKSKLKPVFACVRTPSSKDTTNKTISATDTP